MIPVMNKCDLVPQLHDLPMIGGAVRISATEGTGIDRLLQAIEDNLPIQLVDVELLFPFAHVGAAAPLRKEGVLREETYTEDGSACICKPGPDSAGGDGTLYRWENF